MGCIKYYMCIVLVVLFLNLVLIGDVHAYLDPGTGSFFIQSLIAIAIGAAFVIRQYWSKLKTFFRRLFLRNVA